MASQITIFFSLISFVYGGIITNHYPSSHRHTDTPYYIAAPTIVKHIQPVAQVIKHIEHHESPQPYKFAYGVHDSHTGDVKDQYEIADEHGAVQGSYSLIDADGYKRTVKYTADPHHGFNAEVHREPISH